MGGGGNDDDQNGDAVFVPPTPPPATAAPEGVGGPPRGPPRRGLSNVDEPTTYSNIFGATSNLVNSIVGAGIIGIPFSFRESGLITGFILLVAVGFMTDKSLRMIVESACFHPKTKNLGVLTYEDLMSIPFGKYGSVFVLVSMFIMAYGAMVAYLIIIKDTVPTIFGIADPLNGQCSFLTCEMVMLATSLLIILPLAMLRDMASLSFTSLLSVSADVFLVIFIAVFAPVKSSVQNAGGFGAVLSGNIISAHIFIGLGIISTAMACQHSAFIVSGSLADKTPARWGIVTKNALSFSTVLCCIMGIVGYLGFLDETKGDILNNFEATSFQSNAARALLAITMFFTYPMESFVARHVLAQLIYGGSMDEIRDVNGEIVQESKSCFCFGRREKLTLFIYVATLIPGLLVDDLGPVLSIAGALGASSLAYIGPGLVYLGINGDAFLQHITDKLQYRSGNKSFDSPAVTGQIELPVAGDASAAASSGPTSGGATSIRDLPKPWWWWIGGYPLWVAIASAGSIGTKMKLEEIEKDIFAGTIDIRLDGDGEGLNADGIETIPTIEPCVRDYYISMILIVFGAIAVVVGFVSNVYVQINNIFYTPT